MLKSNRSWCAPSLSTPKVGAAKAAFQAEGLYHPLLASPVGNDISLARGAILSGSNASGKSTFIKAVALAVLLGQALNTCTARSFSCREMLPVTSMAVIDTVVSGDSYFITEIKSLSRTLGLASELPCLVVIDEILRGTNTVERIAASTAVLQHMASCCRDSLIIAATHDIELTTALAGQYDNYHFTEQIVENGVAFDYCLRPGPATSRNAIALLEQLGFPPEVVKQAREAAKLAAPPGTA